MDAIFGDGNFVSILDFKSKKEEEKSKRKENRSEKSREVRGEE